MEFEIFSYGVKNYNVMNLILISSTFPLQKKGNAEASFLRILTPYLLDFFNKIFLIPSARNKLAFESYRRKFYLIGGSNLFNISLYKFINLFVSNLYILYFDIREIVFGKFYFYNFFRSLYVYCKSIVFFSFIEKNIDRGFIVCKDSVIFSFWFDDYIIASILLKYKYNLKLTVSAHGYDIYEERNKGKRIPFRSFSLSNVDIIFPDSHLGMEYIKGRYPSLCNIHNLKLFLPSTSLKPFLSNFSDDGVIRLLSISRTHPVKRLDYLLKVLKLLEIKYQHLKLEWTHIGSGDEYLALCSYCKNLNFNRFKIVFKNDLSDLNIKRFYRDNAVDFFLNVSSSEGTSLALIEALSYGVPVICTKVGGNVYIAERCGFLLNVEFTHNDLFKVIDSLNINKNYYLLLREKAVLAWRDNFNPKVNIYRFINEILR